MAVSARKKVDVVFFRNYSQSDTVSNTQPIRYGEGGKSFDPISWTKNGQALLGWSLSSGSTTISYPTSYTVTDTWIVNNSPRLELYAVYRQPVVSTPSTSTPSTSTPSTPTPSTPTSSTPTSDTPSSETEDTQEADEGTAQGTKKIRVRFISSSYFEDSSQNLVSASQGGLAADSKWAVDPSLRTLLRSVLGKT
jgi:cell division septation protein DedD